MDLSQVTLAQLRYAVAVADNGSFRLAAQTVHVSQPGLSMQIQKLEEHLGVCLFDRSKKPVLATEEGKAALAQMRQVLRETERLGQVVQSHEEPSGRYRLGVIPTLSATVLPLFLAEFVEQFPQVELSIEELPTSSMIERLLSDQLDGGIAATPLGMAGLQETALGLEAFWAYLPPDDPLASRKAVPQAALAERAVWVMPEGHCFRTQVLSLCTPRGELPSARPPVHFESGSFETLIRLVDHGMGMTILPELATKGLSGPRKKRQLRPLKGPVPLREIGFVTARAHLRRSVTEALIGTVDRALGAALSSPPRNHAIYDPLNSGAVVDSG